MEIGESYNYSTINELIILLMVNIEVMKEYMFISINITNIKLLKKLQKKILVNYKNIGVTFKLETNKTILYIYKI